MNPLLIVGSALCNLIDVEEAKKIIDQDCDYMAIGIDVVKLSFPWLYVATYHSDDIPKIKKQGNYKIICHENKRNKEADIIEPHIKPSGSSAMLGVRAAIRLGYKRIILCGCPLIGFNKGNQSYVPFQKGWEKNGEELKPFVRSMSGFTREFLGEPDKGWLLDGT